mmetsp:Transcript_20359/g.78212  ORF Transcript_20359/g.78212 Transcript_20359/m.78212 type:complete len:503 (-) Transcript_20359:64-1572(-)
MASTSEAAPAGAGARSAREHASLSGAAARAQAEVGADGRDGAGERLPHADADGGVAAYVHGHGVHGGADAADHHRDAGGRAREAADEEAVVGIAQAAGEGERAADLHSEASEVALHEALLDGHGGVPRTEEAGDARELDKRHGFVLAERLGGGARGRPGEGGARVVPALLGGVGEGQLVVPDQHAREGLHLNGEEVPGHLHLREGGLGLRHLEPVRHGGHVGHCAVRHGGAAAGDALPEVADVPGKVSLEVERLGAVLLGEGVERVPVSAGHALDGRGGEVPRGGNGDAAQVAVDSVQDLDRRHLHRRDEERLRAPETLVAVHVKAHLPEAVKRQHLIVVRLVKVRRPSKHARAHAVRLAHRLAPDLVGVDSDHAEHAGLAIDLVQHRAHSHPVVEAKVRRRWRLGPRRPAQLHVLAQGGNAPHRGVDIDSARPERNQQVLRLAAAGLRPRDYPKNVDNLPVRALQRKVPPALAQVLQEVVDRFGARPGRRAAPGPVRPARR